MIQLGQEGKDKITGFTGIIVGRCEWLYGCTQYGLAPKVDEHGATRDTQFFDEGRIEIIGDGIAPSEVKAATNGGVNRDAPKGVR